MTYAGPARNDLEVEQALNLATRVFQPNPTGKAAADTKRFYSLDVPGVSDQDIIVVERAGRTVGSVVLIDREMRSGGVALPVSYLTSVCIEPGMQGEGLSRPLMKAARDACVSRGVGMMMLVARRSVDGYYNRFGFWGLSSYNRIIFQVRAATAAPDSRAADASDIPALARLHAETYSEELGCHSRNEAAWRYLLEKMARLEISVRISPAGYLIVREHRVFELALAPDADPIEALTSLAGGRGIDRFELFLSPTHPLAPVFASEGLRVSRECTYGGHMGAIANQSVLLDIVERRVARYAIAMGLPPLNEEIDGIRYSWDGSKAYVAVTGKDDGFWTTSRLFGATQLSMSRHIARLDPLRSFNILMADQL